MQSGVGRVSGHLAKCLRSQVDFALAVVFPALIYFLRPLVEDSRSIKPLDLQAVETALKQRRNSVKTA